MHTSREHIPIGYRYYYYNNIECIEVLVCIQHTATSHCNIIIDQVNELLTSTAVISIECTWSLHGVYMGFTSSDFHVNGMFTRDVHHIHHDNMYNNEDGCMVRTSRFQQRGGEGGMERRG